MLVQYSTQILDTCTVPEEYSAYNILYIMYSSILHPEETYYFEYVLDH